MTKILDCTTRDGGHLTNWEFEDEFVINLIKKLNNDDVNYYEIGYRNHLDNNDKGKFYNCTPDVLTKFYQLKGKLKLGVMTDFKRYCANDFPDKNSDYIDFVRIACRPDKIEQTLDCAKDLYDKGYTVFVQLMDITNVDADGYINLYKWEYKNILESLYIADTYGILTPQEIENYYNKLKILGYERVSFHAHNNNKNALKNSIKAKELGAYSIDITQDGLGRSGGNLNAEDWFRYTKITY